MTSEMTYKSAKRMNQLPLDYPWNVGSWCQARSYDGPCTIPCGTSYSFTTKQKEELKRMQESLTRLIDRLGRVGNFCWTESNEK
jgi:hypothetical protein